MNRPLRSDIAEIYRASWAFALACPLLFAVPIIVEFAQHVVELQAGMYIDKAGAMASEQDPLRLYFGFAKTLALLLPGYWFARYIMFGRDRQKAARIESPAIALWLATFAVMAANSWLSLFGPSLGAMLGLGDGTPGWLTGIMFAAQTVLSIYLFAWLTAWPLGNARIGPITSFGVMHGSFWQSLALWFAGVLPLMILHYALAIAAIVALPPALDWLAMLIDSIVVGFLALTLVGGSVIAARRAAEKKGISLLPQTDIGRSSAA